MIPPSTLHDLVSGRARGVAAYLFRAITGCLEIPVRWYVQRVHRAYNEHRAETYRVAAPVISVGNLTVGGTGKSPFVEWLAQWVREKSREPLLISRGYGSRANQANDEALELAMKLPGIQHWQQADRVAAARAAVEHCPTGVIVLDDAFQHRRLHRDLDIVLLDGLAPFGYEHLLPRGLLREPVEGLARAQIVIISRANLIDDSTRRAIRERVRQLAPHAMIAEAVHEPRGLISAQGERQSLAVVQGKRVGAFCGIGNPRGFRRTLEALECSLGDWREFADHHAYPVRDVRALQAAFERQHCELAVCTLKDLVKIPAASWTGLPLWAVDIGWRFLTGEAKVVVKLRETLQSVGTTSRP